MYDVDDDDIKTKETNIEKKFELRKKMIHIRFTFTVDCPQNSQPQNIRFV